MPGFVIHLPLAFLLLFSACILAWHLHPPRLGRAPALRSFPPVHSLSTQLTWICFHICSSSGHFSSCTPTEASAQGCLCAMGWASDPGLCAGPCPSFSSPEQMLFLGMPCMWINHCYVGTETYPVSSSPSPSHFLFQSPLNFKFPL